MNEPTVVPDPNAEPEKPMMIIRQELIENLKNLLENCPLHAVVILPILKDFISVIENQLNNELMREKQQYEAAMDNWRDGNGRQVDS